MNPSAQDPQNDEQAARGLGQSGASTSMPGQNKVPEVNPTGFVNNIVPADSTGLEERKQWLEAVIRAYEADGPTHGTEIGIKITVDCLSSWLEALITQKETEARLDELERLNFVEASGFLAGGNHVLRQQVVTKRISELKTQQEKK